MQNSIKKNSRIAWCDSVLRWAGSKRRLLPELMRNVPSSYNRYVEPFVGSGCLFFAEKPIRAVLGDINPGLIETYQTICQHPRVVHRLVDSWPRTDSFYYRLRDKFVGVDPISRAARFVYLNRYSFNGVFRTNKQGMFNVPKGTNTGALPSSTLFYRCAIALRGATLIQGDFQMCLADVQPNDFVYLDPPYAKTTSRFRGEYGYGSFAVADLERLLLALTEIDRRGAFFLLSYAKCKDISPALERWPHKVIGVTRHVAGFASSRHRVKEILAANFPLL